MALREVNDGRNAVSARFGENLRHERRRAGLSQEQLASRAGYHRTEIGKLENGERVPRIDTLIALCTVLNVSPLMLLRGIVYTPLETPTEKGSFSAPDIVR